ncbi:hypothetical protein CRENBAI_020949 [Crenichthys baileyi]|uniref:Uncharacterized protein n=1 Tax=Crenichthys baileyi TaxID=28760 RepID=A0AAV9RQ41_9TELE
MDCNLAVVAHSVISLVLSLSGKRTNTVKPDDAWCWADSMECAEDFKDTQKTQKSGTEIGEAAKRLSSKCFAPPPNAERSSGSPPEEETFFLAEKTHRQSILIAFHPLLFSI